MRKNLLLALLCVRSVYASTWFEADYLLWCIKKPPLPIPLVTSASFDDPLPGALGQPHTRVALGKRSIGMRWMQGFQVAAGGWIGSHGGIEGSYFLLPTVHKSKSLHTSGDPGSPNYAVPIFDTTGVFGLKGVPGETIFILPGPLDDDPGFSAKFSLHLKSQLQGAELKGLFRQSCNESFQWDYSGGVRWLRLWEKMVFRARTQGVAGSDVDHAFYNVVDRFETTNDFLAAQVGIEGCYRVKKWHVEAAVKGALGTTLQRVKIQGSSQTSGGNLFFLTQGTGNTVLPGGIFAEPSNRGSHRKTPFAGGFETKIQTGLELTKNIEIHLGYTFLWISSVVRPGDQIDRKINSTRTALADASRATVGVGPGPIPFGTPGPAPAIRGAKRPKVVFKTTSFWAQGLDAGLQFHF